MPPVSNFIDALMSALREYSTNVLISDALEAWTGSEVLKKMERLAAFVEEATAKRAPVIVAFPNSAVNAMSILAVMAADRVPVILSPEDFEMDPASWIERVKPELTLVGRVFETLSEGAMNKNLIVLNATGEIESSTPLRPKFSRQASVCIPEGTALVLFTSGSTGIPKGICVPAAGILVTSQFLVSRFELTNKSVSPVFLPICHSMGLNTHFFPTLLAGGRSHFVDIHLELSKLFRTILSSEGTVVSLIGETLFYCAKEREKRSLSPAERVKHIQLAGGVITEKHLSIARELFPNAVIHKGYGLTEGIRVTMIDHRDPDFNSDAVGFPLPFMAVSLHADGKEITEPRQIGQIWVKGANTYRGILGGELAFDGDQPIPTHDLGYWNERGQLCFVGRDDGLFKYNGKHVSGAEIEKAAMEASHSVQNAKCLVVQDMRTNRPKIVLFVEGLATESDDLESLLYEKLRNLPHSPKQIIFMEKFPTTSNGKMSLLKMKKAYETLERFPLTERTAPV